MSLRLTSWVGHFLNSVSMSCNLRPFVQHNDSYVDKLVSGYFRGSFKTSMIIEESTYFTFSNRF